MDDLCYPFFDERFDLYSLDKKEAVGQNVETRLHKRTCPITNTICKSNFKIFRTIKSRCSSKKQEKLTIVKNNVPLFSRMYISCQTRESDLKNFFSHEKQMSPPSLSENGHLRPAKSKSSIITCHIISSARVLPS